MFNLLDYMTEMPVYYDEATAISGIMVLVIYGIYFLIFGAIYLGMYILNALALYKIGKKLNYNKLYLPWIPLNILPIFILGDLSGRKDFSVTPKLDKFLKVGTRKRSYIIYIALTLLLPVFVLIAGSVLIIFPILMSTGILPEAPAVILMVVCLFIYIAVVFALAGVSAAITVIWYYVYLRDLLDIFKPDRNSNKTLSLVLTLANSFASALVIPIYLLILSRSDPLPEEPQETAEFFTDDVFTEPVQEEDPCDF